MANVMLDELKALPLADAAEGLRMPEILPRRERWLVRKPGLEIVRRGGVYEVRLMGVLYVLEQARVEVRIAGRRLRQLARWLVGRDQWGTLHAHLLEFVEDRSHFLDTLHAWHRWLDRAINRLGPEWFESAVAVVDEGIRRSDRLVGVWV